MNTTFTHAPLVQIPCDLLIIGIGTDQIEERLSVLGSLGTDLMEAAKQDEFKAESGQSFSYPSYGRVPATQGALVGLAGTRP